MRSDDFAADIGAGHRFSTAVAGGHKIVATGVRSESRRIHSSTSGVGPRALRGCGAETCGDELPGIAVRAAHRQVQHDAPHRGLDPGAEFHEVFAQGVDSGGSVNR
jgi:hypothetical protein